MAKERSSRRRSRSRDRSGGGLEAGRSRSRDREEHRDRRHRSRSKERYKSRERRRSRERHRSKERQRSRERQKSREWRSTSRDRGPPQDHQAPLPLPPLQLPPPPNLPPPVHSIHKGTVHTIRPFGLFVQIPNYRRHVLVHHSQISDDIRFAKDDEDEDKIKAMEFFLPKGQEVWVKLTEVTLDAGRGEFKINGTLRTVNQETGDDLDPLNKKIVAKGGGGPLTDEPPEEGTVHTAVVKRIEPYGVFVQLQGYRKYGLVHSSQVSSYISFSKEDTDESKKAELSGVVSIGDNVSVKVVEIIPDDGMGRGPKIQCSIKLVDQATGEDLDPTNLRYKPRGMEAGFGGGQGSAPLGASAGTVKSGGKIDWGYLAGNDRLVAGDHAGKYKMLEDDEGTAGAPGSGGAMAQVQELPPPPPQPLPPPPPPPTKFASVEEALAVLEQAQAKAKAKDKKHKDKGKKKKKSKDKKEKKEKKSKKRKERSPSSSSSSSD